MTLNIKNQEKQGDPKKGKVHGWIITFQKGKNLPFLIMKSLKIVGNLQQKIFKMMK